MKCINCKSTNVHGRAIKEVGYPLCRITCLECGTVGLTEMGEADKNKTENLGIDRIEQIFDERKELFIKKNKNYSNSYIKTGKIISLILENQKLVISNEKDQIAIGLMHRMLDKIVRYINLRFTEQEDEVQESIAETIGDLGVYSFMLQELEEEKKLWK